MITFAVTVCNEYEELNRLLRNIEQVAMSDDELIVIGDKDRITDEVKKIIDFHRQTSIIDFRFELFELGNDFATYKNNFFDISSNEWIFQLDADEYLHESFSDTLHYLLESNENLDLIKVPRINTVNGITLEHVQKWGWQISKINDLTDVKEFKKDNPEYLLLSKYNLIIEEHLIPYKEGDFNIEEYEDTWKEQRYSVYFHKPVINFPDYQDRIYKNNKKIKWINKVHERLDGVKNYSFLPQESDWCIFHEKDIQRQERQNKFYNSI